MPHYWRTIFVFISTFLAASSPANANHVPGHFGSHMNLLGNPGITDLSPSIGSAGSVVTISGKELGQQSGKVLFGSVPAKVNSWSRQSIEVVAPANQGVVNVTVVGKNGRMKSPTNFTYCGSVVPTPIPSPGPGVTPSPAPRVTPAPSVSPTPNPGSFWGNTHIPFQLPGGMTASQADAILSLVSIAENSTTSWWTAYNYIEDIKDGRGYTINIVGFCTGTGDFLWVVQDLQKFSPNHALVKYLPALQKVNNSASHAGLDPTFVPLIKSLGNDADYLKAAWDGIIYFYWGTANTLADQLGLKYAISRGQLYDIALNMGDVSLAKKVKSPAPINGGDEKAWLSELQGLWLNQITEVDKSLDSGQPDRALMWQSILKSGNVNLDRPINNLTCYGEKFSVN